MKRIPFSQVLTNASIDIFTEYSRLYAMFCVHTVEIDYEEEYTLKQICARGFLNLPFRGTCITIEDFEKVYNRKYEVSPKEFDINYLVSFCEYTYNLAMYNQNDSYGYYINCETNAMQLYVQQVLKVIESIGYKPLMNCESMITDFVPKDQAAISVSEIVDPSLSYKVIEYNHHSMKGQLSKKKEILLSLADRLEPERHKLRQINSSLESDLFFLLNNVNLRHNNSDTSGKNYNSVVASMSRDEIEKWYDKTYQVCLLAFLELDHIDRKDQIAELKEQIQR